MTYLLTIDPGLQTGVALGEYGDDLPYRVVQGWQIAGGAEGFLRWVTIQDAVMAEGQVTYGFDRVVAEKFTPRAMAGFSHTQASTEPLRVEGVIVALGLDPVWRQPSQQYWVAGKSVPEKRKKQKAQLKEWGMYKMPKELGHKDSEDYCSAVFHAISWLRSQHHRPTLAALFKGEDRDD